MTKVKTILPQRNNSSAATGKLTGYYRSRLSATRSAIEAEAIVYMSSLLSLCLWNTQDNEESK